MQEKLTKLTKSSICIKSSFIIFIYIYIYIYIYYSQKESTHFGLEVSAVFGLLAHVQPKNSDKKNSERFCSNIKKLF